MNDVRTLQRISAPWDRLDEDTHATVRGAFAQGRSFVRDTFSATPSQQIELTIEYVRAFVATQANIYGVIGDQFLSERGE